jgi:hypothetical protein
VALVDHLHLAAAVALDAQQPGRKHLRSDRFERDSEGLRADGGQRVAHFDPAQCRLPLGICKPIPDACPQAGTGAVSPTTPSARRPASARQVFRSDA